MDTAALPDINRFTVRVYGLLIKDGHVLISHERMNQYSFTKFPGGGLEFGEGPEDCVIREFKEETGLEISIVQHFYTTGFFQRSAFKATDQLISIYYLVNTAVAKADIDLSFRNLGPEEQIQLEWAALESLHESQFTFPIDKLMVDLLQQKPV